MTKKKPDQVVDNPGIMPYTTNIGAPAIRKDDVDLWKQRGVAKVNHQFKARFEELKKQYEQLVDEFEWKRMLLKVVSPVQKGFRERILVS